MGKPAATTARPGLRALLAAAAAGVARAGVASPGGLAAAGWPTAAASPSLLDDAPAGGNSTADQLKAEIAWLKQEIQNETDRINAAESAATEANATLRVEDHSLATLHAELASAKESTKEAREEAARARAELEQIEGSGREKVGPVGVWLAELPHQQVIAVVVGILGLLSVLGPSVFTRAFLAITGSAVGGLMVGGCVTFFVGVVEGGGPTWLTAVRMLLEGSGIPAGYGSWAVMLFLGIFRWLKGYNCGVYGVAEEVCIQRTGDLSDPLLPPQQEARGNYRPGGFARDSV